MILLDHVSTYAKLHFLDQRVTHGVTFFLGSPESPLSHFQPFVFWMLPWSLP